VQQPRRPAVTLSDYQRLLTYVNDRYRPSCH
jgi:hypothetical protein